MPQEPNTATESDESPAEVIQISPWPILRQVSNDECWEKMTEADYDILGMDRAEWELTHPGTNPCNDPREKS